MVKTSYLADGQCYYCGEPINGDCIKCDGYDLSFHMHVTCVRKFAKELIGGPRAWEIGRVSCEDGPAMRVIGPFSNRDWAIAAMNKLNHGEPQGYPRWMWAEYKEITRSEGCLEIAPDRIPMLRPGS